MKTALLPYFPALLALLLAGTATTGLPAHGANGDIDIQVLDLWDQPIRGTDGGRATLLGVDDRGVCNLGTKSADAAGRVVFTAQEIRAATMGSFAFVVQTQGTAADLRGQLYDPFGRDWTYIRYESDRPYLFAVSTPTAGSPVPEVVWKGSESKIRFHVDLGRYALSDFWFHRVLIQKKAATPDQAGSSYGISPVLDSDWLAAHQCTLEDGGLAVGQTGPIRVSKPGFDEQFLATKLASSASARVQHAIHLVTCLWNQTLPATYSNTGQLYEATFDPRFVFGDTNAPAWEGPDMKAGVPYFLGLQIERWIWDDAGAQQGVANAIASPLAGALFYPARLPQEETRLVALAYQDGRFFLQIAGNPAWPFRILSASGSCPPVSWLDRAVTNVTDTPFVFADEAGDAARFYRVQQR